jgi:eukaryotic-like serine/threonine-protein kinase
MTAQRWARIKEAFGAVLEAPEAERARRLESACAGDAELRAEVERLLAGSEEPSLASPAAHLFGAADGLKAGEMVGRTA